MPLLPSGLFDYLPPQAALESWMIHALLSHFKASGYEQVTPPLMEYEDTLIPNTAIGTQSFRVMDPLTQRMLAVRADMTMQIARIAGHQMHASPRPLRLCYAGQTLRTLPDAMRSTRQFRQSGIELFGVASAEADIEIIQTAVTAVHAMGLHDISIDLHYSVLLDELTETLSDSEKITLREAIRRKDISAISSIGGAAIATLAECCGDAERVFKSFDDYPFPNQVKQDISSLRSLTDRLKNRLGHAAPRFTVDILDMQGFGYYSGFSFSLFLHSAQREIGRGGRYETSHGETAVGFTLYTEDLLPWVAPQPLAKQLLLSGDTTNEQAATYKAQGYVACYAMTDDVAAEARAHGFDAYAMKDTLYTTVIPGCAGVQ